MQFAQPLWLVAGAVACALLAWQFRRFDRAQRAALTQFAAARLLGRLTSSISPRRRAVKRTLFTLGVGFVFVALARPQAGFEWQETHRKGLELLFAVDTSKSMLAQDVKPDRLTRAKLGVTDLVAKLKGDGVGLVAFAGNAFLQCPVTLDYDAFRESLDALDVHVIPRGGTNIAAAIREAEAVFQTRTTAEKILVLITDGEDLDGEGVVAAKRAAASGVKIFAVGVGSATGELVPLPGANSGTEFARDEKGEFVKSHLDETTLRKIAEATGGMYQPLGAQGEGLTAIYDQGLASFAREDLSSRQTKVPLERFHWALLAALACFVAEHLVGNRRNGASTKATAPVRAPKISRNLRPAAATAVVMLAGIVSGQAATPQSAERAYQQGDFTKSQQEYAATAAEQPASAELQFNTGSAAYKAGDYAQAANGFQQSLKTEKVEVQQDAYYNLGNTQYRLGQKTEKENPQETIKTWEEAVKSYDAALQIKPADTEAKHNRDLVQRKIERLKKQEEQKKQEQEKQQDQKDQQQKQDAQTNQDQQTQSQNQKGESKDQDKDSKDESQNKDSQPQSKDQQSTAKVQADQPKDQPGDSQSSKDQKTGDQGQQPNSKNQKDDAKNNQGGDSKDTQPPDSKPEEQRKSGEPKDARDSDQNRRDESQPQPGEEKKDEAKAQKTEGQPRSGDDKKDDAQPEAKSGAGTQPKPVDPAKKPSQGQAEAASGEKPGDAQAAAEAAADNERHAPGQMTKAEAKQLLDALKGDERKAPAISAQGRAAGQPNDHKTLKDW